MRCLNFGTDKRSRETGSDGCPILDAHSMGNYEQHGDDRSSTALEQALSVLIPTGDVGNGECAKFRPRQPSGTAHDDLRRAAIREGGGTDG